MDIKKDKTAQKQRQRPGRKSKISPEIIAEICQGIEAGMTQATAARRAGISNATFYRWIDKGKKAQDGIFQEYWQALSQSQAKVRGKIEENVFRLALPHQVITEKEVIHPKTGEIITLREIKTVTDTALARFILERRWPEDWGKKDKLDLTTDGNPFEMPLIGSIMGQGEAKEQ